MTPRRIMAPDQTLRHRLRRHLESRSLEALYRIRQLPKWAKKFIFISAGARIITYASVFSHWINKSWSLQIVDPFLFWSQPMPRCWLIRYFTDDLYSIMMAWTVCILAALVSDLVFLVSVIWLGWHVIDAAMFWVNYKHTPMVYLDLTWTALILIWTAMKGYSKETVGRIKSIF
jgi:hypothetical protein